MKERILTDDIGGRLGRDREQSSKRMRILRHNVMSFDASWWAGQMVDDAMRRAEMADFRERSERRWSPRYGVTVALLR